MAKSLIFTYILWLFGGWLGLHHFYLGRDRQAFVWWSTFGGGFGLGWVRDIWRIPEYVADANENVEYMRHLVECMRFYKKPPFSGTRFAAQLFVGSFFGYLALLAVPEEIDEQYYWIRLLLIPAAVAIGVDIISNIGRQTTSFKYTILAAYAVSLLVLANPNSVVHIAILCALVSQYFRTYRHVAPKKRHFCTRIAILGAGGSVVILMWILFLGNNASVTTADGETIKLRDAVQHFLNSPAWRELKDTLYKIYQRARSEGWERVYDEFVESLDPLGEINAYKVLDLERSASQEEITKRYRKLAKEWHPDRQPNNQEEAQAKFIEIQQAYEILSNIKQNRARKNKKSRDSPSSFHRTP
ncbi:dnaJ homolog subfamily C member 22-like [Glandiceps talaboti]